MHDAANAGNLYSFFCAYVKSPMGYIMYQQEIMVSIVFKILNAG